jgi:hypothetical protein
MKGGWRVFVAAVVLLVGGVGIVNSALSAPASSIVPSDQLAAHGIELGSLALTAPAAVITSATARATAKAAVGTSVDPDETWRVSASETYNGQRRSAWLFLFRGGTGPVSAGPAGGTQSRTLTTTYTGVLVDDQTGLVMRWFSGGSVSP